MKILVGCSNVRIDSLRSNGCNAITREVTPPPPLSNWNGDNCLGLIFLKHRRNSRLIYHRMVRFLKIKPVIELHFRRWSQLFSKFLSFVCIR